MKCHQNVAVPAPPSSRVAFFSHAQHLKMGNIAPMIASAINKKMYLQPASDIRRHLSASLNTGLSTTRDTTRDTQGACQACHRGLEESEQVTVAAMPQIADCLVCHTEIDNPFSCEKCHSKDAQLKLANHVSGFNERAQFRQAEPGQNYLHGLSRAEFPLPGVTNCRPCRWRGSATCASQGHTILLSTQHPFENKERSYW